MNTDTNATTRPLGARAQVLSTRALIELGATTLEAQRPDLVGFTLGPEPHVLIAADRGVPAVIDADGTGYLMDDDQMIRVTYGDRYGQPFTLAFTLEQIDQALTGDTIDLADVISRGAEGDRRHAEWWGRYDVDYNPAPAEGDQTYCAFCDQPMTPDAKGEWITCPNGGDICLDCCNGCC